MSNFVNVDKVIDALDKIKNDIEEGKKILPEFFKNATVNIDDDGSIDFIGNNKFQLTPIQVGNLEYYGFIIDGYRNTISHWGVVLD